MKIDSQLSGVWTAIVTPFKENLEVDFTAFRSLVVRQVEAGVRGIVVAGTTGESPTLSLSEKIDLIIEAQKVSKGQIQIMAGTGSNSTAQTIELSKAAEQAGADSLLVVTPPYNKPSLSGLIDHFSIVAKSVNIPICLYHVPARTGLSLSAEELYSLSRVDGIAGIKEASGDLALFTKTVALCGKDISVLSGDDPTFLASLGAGGSGIISVLTNLLPKYFVKMQELMEEGQIKESLRINSLLLPLIECLFIESNPAPTKAALCYQDLCQNRLRPPLTTCEKGNHREVIQTLENTIQNVNSI